ncbi:LIF receptor subunit alpha b [Salminus brasiliensis]|uniref:LIF receptor subunit alpha b n=1 Tax=Salminus brasiliensis TaxID=930266 RepID=UPI003B82E60C
MNFLCPVMASECFWPLCALMFLAVAQGKQYEHNLPVPEIVRVYSNASTFGDWKMNTEWRDNFLNSNKPEKVTYDLEIFHTEQMRLVHNETVEVKPDLTGKYHWSWTSPLPLQCTSHSVRLRYRDHIQTSDWTPFYILKGKDAEDISKSTVYPKSHVAMVGDSIIFCCILKSETVAGFKSSDFKIRISNRTYVTEPVSQNKPSKSGGINVACDHTGITYFTGYAPDAQNLTCETRDLISVECHWNPGRFVGEAFAFKILYSINGRNCSVKDENKPMCVLNENINKGKTVWTLSAKNGLGEKIIRDTADPKHRVRLQAPKLAHAVLVHARNATLKWKWSRHFSNFSMICQVEVNNIIKETNGTGLHSVFLPDLQPFTNYTARVRCSSQEHFYKWGDWSSPITFTTKEDIPEAVDVWMQVLGKQTYIVWKNPTVTQSHGIIKGYKLLVGSPTNASREIISKAANEYCHKLSPGSTERDHIISVSARNSKGVSSPSKITIPSLGSDSGIISTPISGHNGVFNVSWEPSPLSSCGYVVDWFPTYSTECSVKWMKTYASYATPMPVSDFENGVKYTLSVYACTSGAPQLLQRRTGYAQELPPSGKVRNLTVELQGSETVLSWEEVAKKEQKGVILGYKVSYIKTETGDGYKHLNVSKNCNQGTSGRVECRLSNLSPGDYNFKVKAFTSAGAGPEVESTRNIDVGDYRLVVSILTALGTAACVITIIALCCIKREWLKSKLYPEIPKPRLSDEWFTEGFRQYPVIDKVLLAEKEVLMAKNPEASLQIVPLKGHEDVELMSRDLPQTTYCYEHCDSKTASLITVDPSYIDVPCPGIQNPTYNLTLSVPVDANLVLGYCPQIQNINNQFQACDVTPIQMDSDYHPQSAVTVTAPGETNNSSLPFNSSSVSSPNYLLHNACS